MSESIEKISYIKFAKQQRSVNVYYEFLPLTPAKQIADNIFYSVIKLSARSHFFIILKL